MQSIYRKQRLRLCRVCELEFRPTDPRHRGGFIDICGYCGEDDVPRAIGVLENKGKTDYSVEVLLNPSPRQRAFVQRQGSATANTCQKSIMLGGYGDSAKQKEE